MAEALVPPAAGIPEFFASRIETADHNGDGTHRLWFVVDRKYLDGTVVEEPVASMVIPSRNVEGCIRALAESLVNGIMHDT